MFLRHKCKSNLPRFLVFNLYAFYPYGSAFALINKFKDSKCVRIKIYKLNDPNPIISNLEIKLM
jgi:hypothetical protein